MRSNRNRADTDASEQTAGGAASGPTKERRPPAGRVPDESRHTASATLDCIARGIKQLERYADNPEHWLPTALAAHRWIGEILNADDGRRSARNLGPTLVAAMVLTAETPAPPGEVRVGIDWGVPCFFGPDEPPVHTPPPWRQPERHRHSLRGALRARR